MKQHSHLKFFLIFTFLLFAIGVLGTLEIKKNVPEEPLPKLESEAPLKKKNNKRRPHDNDGTRIVRRDLGSASKLGENDPLYPANPSDIQDLKQKDPYRRGKILEISESPLDGDSQFKRTRLIKLKGKKYPFIQVEEKIAINPNSGEESVLSRKAFAADHVMVKIKGQVTEQKLVEIARLYNGKILRRMNAAQYYLISFDDRSIDGVHRMTQNFLNESEVIEHSGPDILVGTP